MPGGFSLAIPPIAIRDTEPCKPVMRRDVQPACYVTICRATRRPLNLYYTRWKSRGVVASCANVSGSRVARYCNPTTPRFPRSYTWTHIAVCTSVCHHGFGRPVSHDRSLLLDPAHFHPAKTVLSWLSIRNRDRTNERELRWTTG